MYITNLEVTQATIEIFSGFICLMLAVIITMNGRGRASWRLLKWMLFSVSIIFFAESAAYIFRGNTNRVSIFMTRSSNFTVFLFNIILLKLFIHYMYHLLKEKGVAVSGIYKRIVNVCQTAALVILLTNVSAKWMYYFDEVNYYHRNTGWYVYTICNLLSILASCAMSIRYRKTVSKIMLSSLLTYALMPVAAIVLQAFFYGISITNIGIFIAMLFMLVAYLKEWGQTAQVESNEQKSLGNIVLFAIMTISMSVSIFSCVVSIERISSENSQSDSMMVAHMVSDRMENKFLRPIVVAETMANDYSLKKYMKKSGIDSPESVEKAVGDYLDSIRNGFGYQMVFAVCDASKAYYTYDGISKFVDTEKNDHDIWYQKFLEEGKHYDLDVDTDEANQWALSVFVNTEITDEKGNFLGVCGVGVEMTDLQKLLQKYEKKYNIKIDLIDSTGLIQVDSDASRIERDYLDNSYLQDVGSVEFYYERLSNSSRMTKYMKELDWYLVVEDLHPDKINVLEITMTSIVIFVIGLFMMGIVFAVISIRERKASRELMERRKMSLTDDMTGLLNRRAFAEDCMKVQKEKRVLNTTIIMLDVNGLKTANDLYGHMAGDALIIGAAKCIQTAVGEYGNVYRTGGDEFVALLECTKGQLDDLLRTMEHLIDRRKGAYQCELAISKGVVVCREHEDLTFDEMKKLADQLMYEDKDEYYRRTGKVRRNMEERAD